MLGKLANGIGSLHQVEESPAHRKGEDERLFASNQWCLLQISSSEDCEDQRVSFILLELTLGLSNAYIVVILCQAMFTINLFTPNSMGKVLLGLPSLPILGEEAEALRG